MVSSTGQFLGYDLDVTIPNCSTAEQWDETACAELTFTRSVLTGRLLLTNVLGAALRGTDPKRAILNQFGNLTMTLDGTRLRGIESFTWNLGKNRGQSHHWNLETTPPPPPNIY